MRVGSYRGKGADGKEHDFEIFEEDPYDGPVSQADKDWFMASLPHVVAAAEKRAAEKREAAQKALGCSTAVI